MGVRETDVPGEGYLVGNIFIVWDHFETVKMSQTSFQEMSQLGRSTSTAGRSLRPGIQSVCVRSGFWEVCLLRRESQLVGLKRKDLVLRGRSEVRGKLCIQALVS